MPNAQPSEAPVHTYQGATYLLINEYVPDPLSCEIEYSCLNPTVVDSDICSVGTLNSETGVFELSTTDKSTYPQNTYKVKIKGSIEGFSSRSYTHEFQFKLEDLCSAATVTIPTQTEPANHTYQGTTSFTAEYFIESDDDCSIVYSCEPPDAASAVTNLCDVGTLGSTGRFDLSVTDMSTYPPGDYPVEIKGSISGFSDHDSHTFTYTLVDPCSLATVTIPLQSDPDDHTYQGTTSFQASFTSSDADCDITYTCVPQEGDDVVDLCDVGTFNEATGLF